MVMPQAPHLPRPPPPPPHFVLQVHRGVLPDGRVVAVKVQHSSARRTMASDLANLSHFSGLMSACRFDLGFDHASLIREYNAQVRCGEGGQGRGGCSPVALGTDKGEQLAARLAQTFWVQIV